MSRFVWIVAAGLAVLDTVARMLIAARFGASIPDALLMCLLVFGLMFLVLRAAELVRSDGIAIAMPIAGLLTVGDVVAVRIAEGHSTLHAELPLLCAVVVFVITLAAIGDVAWLQGAGARLGLAGAILIALPLCPVIGLTVGGQAGWIKVAGLQVAPGELGRPLVLIGFAAALAELPVLGRETRDWSEARLVAGRALVIPAMAVAVHVLERDLGSALLLALALAGVLSVAMGAMRWFGIALASAAVALAGFSLFSARLQGRLLDVFQPLRRLGGGYDQAGLAHLALAWGGWKGVGFGGGLVDRVGAIPAAGTDYVLAQWTLEAGLVGLLAVMALLGWLLAVAWTWSLRTTGGFRRLAAAGLAWLLTISTVWTTGAVLGVLPLSGLPSPFVSGASNATAAAVVTALLCRCAPSPAFSSVRLAETVRLARVLALAAVGLIAVLSIRHISAQRLELDRRLDNPWREWSTLNRGPILARDATVLARSTGTGSLDTVARRYGAGRLVGGIVGHITFADQSGGGVEDAWRALLRCGGSGQARPAGLAWSAGATRVAGDPANCRPAGVQLSLDLSLQRAAFRALRGKLGAIVVLDARSGEILAAAGHLRSAARPAPLAPFDLLAAPGSTFKIVTAAAVLKSGIAGRTPVASGFAAGGRWLANAGGERCGGALPVAFAESCNSSFARLGLSLGASTLAAAAERLGFGARTLVSGIPTATSTVNLGAAPSAELLAASSIGQGAVEATPLQMALVAATVAEGGVRPQPMLVDRACGAGRPKPVRLRELPLWLARSLRGDMRAVTLTGTGIAAAHAPGAWALKTGTAELPRLVQAGSPSGTGGWVVGFPTTPTRSGVRPAVAALILPGSTDRLRSGPVDGTAVLDALAPAVMALAPARPACT